MGPLTLNTELNDHLEILKLLIVTVYKTSQSLTQLSACIEKYIQNPTKFEKLITSTTNDTYPFNPIMKQYQDHECGIVCLLFMLEFLNIFHTRDFKYLEENRMNGVIISYTMNPAMYPLE